MTVKVYKSKQEIFKDYQLAVKFRLRWEVSEDRYTAFFDALRCHLDWKLVEFSREVAHIKKHYANSVGLFAEFPIEVGDGSVVGAKCVLLEHESGPEIFFALKAAALCGLVWLGHKGVDKIDEHVTQKVCEKLVKSVPSTDCYAKARCACDKDRVHHRKGKSDAAVSQADARS